MKGREGGEGREAHTFSLLFPCSASSSSEWYSTFVPSFVLVT